MNLSDWILKGRWGGGEGVREMPAKKELMKLG